MSGFSDYLAEVSAGIQEGAGDVASSAIADIGDSYQEVLMSDASVSPPDPVGAQQFETITTTAEPDTGGVELESYGPNSNDAIPGLDIA